MIKLGYQLRLIGIFLLFFAGCTTRVEGPMYQYVRQSDSASIDLGQIAPTTISVFIDSIDGSSTISGDRIQFVSPGTHALALSIRYDEGQGSGLPYGYLKGHTPGLVNVEFQAQHKYILRAQLNRKFSRSTFDVTLADVTGGVATLPPAVGHWIVKAR
jgi:hypothetical protein